MNRRNFVGGTLGALSLSWCSRGIAQDTLFAEYLSEIAGQIDQPKAVVVQSTTVLLPDRMSEWKTSRDIQAANSIIQDSTASELLSVGSTSRPISIPTARLPTKLSVFHVTEQDVRRIFEQASLTRSWEQFYREFPNSIGVLSFSNVGFNDLKDQAAFVLSVACGGLCGSGHLVVMKRSTTGWHSEESKSLWMS